MKKLLFLPLCLLSVVLMAQTTNADYLAYIEAYKQAAVNQELTYKIPASITLAQGLLESGAGKSPLAKEANNHFGIKCHSDWTGATFTQDDDAVGECFRKYDSAEQSYEDHAKFLLKPRYQKLFSLPITDYKGWARGLKECGYATDPNYAPKLIKLIEDYDLVAITEANKYSKESKNVE
ncbi:MAG: glucosaminidase domain-containing protein, partial [Bacteroidales bacterium]|nr:glucosaminidase domain-containing protein [Candidatus Colicola faecequi]